MANTAKVGIISIGDMGVGIAKVLVAKGFAVFTNCKGRSQDTIDRATEAKVIILDSDVELVETCDIILSVVPPRDAVKTAQRIIDALSGSTRNKDTSSLYFADMNAVSPATSKSIAAMLSRNPALPVRYVDGCILGGPPSVKSDDDTQRKPASVTLMPTSGPHDLAPFPGLAAALNSRHISPDIGSGSGLKMCFAALHKGLAAITVQSFATAHALGVLPELQRSLKEVSGPERATQAERSAVGVAPKAYRWAGEMEEIAATFSEEAGFEGELFKGAAEVFRMMAEDTVLGKEKVGKRVRGATVEDVAVAVREGMNAKRKKME